jgi:tetratricopeptide (TPR) repeat protein
MQGGFRVKSGLKIAVGALALAGMALVPATVTAQQATLELRSGDKTQTATGTITGVANGQVKFKLPNGNELGIPLTNVAGIQMAAPKDYDEGNKLFNEGKDLPALTKFSIVETQYRGLPTPWMAVTLARLGQLNIRLNQFEKAEAFFAQYGQIFKGADALPLAELGKAQIAFAKGDNETARTALGPVVEGAKTLETATEYQANFYANAFYTLGQVQEAAKDYPAALESYLKVVTLYYRDAGLLVEAENKAKALRAAHPEVAVP